MQGTTKIIQHPIGGISYHGFPIPSRLIETGDTVSSSDDCGSRIGGNPSILQNENLETKDLKFRLQLRSSNFPGKFTDIFGLSDALGYVYLKENSQLSEKDVFSLSRPPDPSQKAERYPSASIKSLSLA